MAALRLAFKKDVYKSLIRTVGYLWIYWKKGILEHEEVILANHLSDWYIEAEDLGAILAFLQVNLV